MVQVCWFFYSGRTQFRWRAGVDKRALFNPDNRWIRLKFWTIHENFVGVAKGQFAVAGLEDPEGNTLGWTLDWENSELDACAVISWSGQTQYLPNGVPVILTTWVITRQTTSEENWSSTLIGTDQFYPINSPPANCGSKAFAFFSQRG